MRSIKQRILNWHKSRRELYERTHVAESLTKAGFVFYTMEHDPDKGTFTTVLKHKYTGGEFRITTTRESLQESGRMVRELQEKGVLPK